MFKLAIILLVDILLFVFVGKIAGIIGLLILIYRLVSGMGFIRPVEIFRGDLPDGVLFYKNYTGTYSKLFEPFKEVDGMISKFKGKKSYYLCEICYDNPQLIAEGKQRCTIGLFKKKFTEDFASNEELENYATQNGYTKADIKRTPGLNAKWTFMNTFSMLLGIRKFYKELDISFKDKGFLRNYKIKEDNYKACVSLYEKNTINFYVPISECDHLLLHDTFKNIEGEETKEN